MQVDFREGYKIREQSATHFLTFSVVGWIDIFSRQRYRDIILDSFRYCQKCKGLRVTAWVIMTNHIHTIWTTEGHQISDVIRDFKTFTSKAITRSIEEEPESRKSWLLHMFRFHANRTNKNDRFKVWTSSNHPEEIYSHSFLLSKINYIHQNPVRAGIVREPSHYLYSSAVDYEESGPGLLKIHYLF